MSIKLRFEKGSLNTTVTLKDEALAGLLALVSEHQDDSAPASTSAAVPVQGASATAAVGGVDVIATAKAWLSSHTASEVLNLMGWDTFPEKILLLAAFHEAKGETGESWRSADMLMWFTEAREAQPKNFPRDISVAIKDGIIGTVTARTYQVSRKGWNTIAEAIQAISEY